MRSVKSFFLRVSDGLRSLPGSTAATRLLACGMIGLLMLVDFQNLYAMFTSPQANTTARNAFWFSLTLCLALELQPVFLGMSVSKLTDRTRHCTNDRIGAIVGCAVSAAGTLLAFGVFLYIKGLEIAAAGGKAAFLAGTYSLSSASYMVQVLLLASPILTSLLAFVISWSCCGVEARHRLERQLENARRRMVHAHRCYRHQAERVELERTRLWAGVSAHSPMPCTLAEYRAAVCLRIRNKTIETVLAAFPLVVERYQQAVECRLQQSIHRMAACSSVPLAIEQIDLAGVLARYDANQPDDGMAWSLQRALPVLEDGLKRGVDNAVVQAQSRILGD